jgi:hypothetical protein
VYTVILLVMSATRARKENTVTSKKEIFEVKDMFLCDMTFLER